MRKRKSKAANYTKRKEKEEKREEEKKILRKSGRVLRTPELSLNHDQDSAPGVSDTPHLLYRETPEIALISGNSL